MIINNYDNKNFLTRRREFVDWILRNAEYDVCCACCGGKAEKGKLELQNTWVKKSANGKEFMAKLVICSKCGGADGRRIYSPKIKFYVLHPDYENYPAAEVYSGLNFDRLWNTRDILIDEAVFEFEKGINWRENIQAFWDAIQSLIRWEVHFAAFYAQGMRAPHIHAYGLFPNVEDWAEKELTYHLFCQKVFPIEIRHLLDTALAGQQTIALEFSKHWRSGRIKKLLFEYTPGGKYANC